MLAKDQVNFYHEHGFLRIPEMFTPQETDELADELDRLVQDWSFTSPGWTGPWRQAYMDPEVEKKSKLTAMHDLHFYSDAWMRCVTHPRLTAAIADLIGPNVELHHSTMHIKPPQHGHPFPMHQDNPFYTHSNECYVDVLVHLDDTRHENGEIRFLDGSHKLGALEHVTQLADGTPCTPHLPTDQYRLEETVPVPAKRGDVVLFCIYTIHSRFVHQPDQQAAPHGAHRLSRSEKCPDFRPEYGPSGLYGSGLSRTDARPGIVLAGIAQCPESFAPDFLRRELFGRSNCGREMAKLDRSCFSFLIAFVMTYCHAFYDPQLVPIVTIRV